MRSFYHIFVFNYKKMIKSWMFGLMAIITLVGVMAGSLIYQNESEIKQINLHVVNSSGLNVSADQIATILTKANNQIHYHVTDSKEVGKDNKEYSKEQLLIQLLEDKHGQVQLVFSYKDTDLINPLQKSLLSQFIQHLMLEKQTSGFVPTVTIVDRNPVQDQSVIYASYIVAFFLYLFILLCGSIITNSVALEKTSRVSDLISYRISPIILVYGKIAALFALLVQLAAITALELVAMHTFHIVDFSHLMDLLKGLGFSRNVIMIISIAFVIGIAVYTIMYVAIGLLIQSAEQIQFSQFPVAAIALTSFILSVFCNRNPNGIVSELSMYIPFLYPFILPIRLLGKISNNYELAISQTIVILYLIIGNILIKKLFFSKG